MSRCKACDNLLDDIALYRADELCKVCKPISDAAADGVFIEPTWHQLMGSEGSRTGYVSSLITAIEIGIVVGVLAIVGAPLTALSFLAAVLAVTWVVGGCYAAWRWICARS